MQQRGAVELRAFPGGDQCGQGVPEPGGGDEPSPGTVGVARDGGPAPIGSSASRGSGRPTGSAAISRNAASTASTSPGRHGGGQCAPGVRSSSTSNGRSPSSQPSTRGMNEVSSASYASYSARSHVGQGSTGAECLRKALPPEASSITQCSLTDQPPLATRDHVTAREPSRRSAAADHVGRRHRSGNGRRASAGRACVDTHNGVVAYCAE